MNIKILALWAMGLAFAPYLAPAQQQVDSLARNLPDTAARKLEEVVVKGDIPYVEHRVDRTVLHVDALLSNAGATAYEVLEKAPGVLMQNGTINLKGKAGVQIFIDNKPTYVSGTDLENLLKSIPADRLLQVELMTNPSAKYEAAGNAGIINIITRKSKVKGFNGGVNLALRQSRQTSSYNTVFFNYRKDKLNFFANISGGYRQNFEDLDIHRVYKLANGQTQGSFDQNAYSVRKGGFGRANVGLDFYHSEQTTLGIAFTGNLWQAQRNERINGTQLWSDGTEAYTVKGRNTDNTLHKDGWLNLNYRHAFNQPGQELTIDADHLIYSHDPDQSFDNTIEQPGNPQPARDLLEGKLASDIHIYTLKADYTQPLFRQYKLDAGLKTAYTQTDNDAAYQYTTAGITRPDYDKSNHFKYKENINAAYVNLAHEGRRLSLQAGLRLENTNADGHQLGNPLKADSAFQKRYTNLFPTFYALYKLDTTGNHVIGLNYGRRIDRPYFQDLNPFVTPIDRFTYYTGNPFLRPAFTHSLELAYSYKSMITVTLGYSNSKDNVNETVAIENDIFYSKPDNIGRRIVKSINVDASKELNSWLSIHLYAEWTHIHAKTDFYAGLLDTKGSYVLISPDCHIRLGKTWTAELSGKYVSSVYNVQLQTGAYWLMNIGIQKRFSDAASLKLSVRDLFFTQVNSGTIHNLSQATASWKNKSDTQMAILSFSYRFGKAIAGQRKHEATGAQGEQNRVKN